MRTPVRLYFFPAALPLVELLPWLLTAFGALAGFLIGSSNRGRWRKLVWPTRILVLVALITGGIALWPRIYWRLHAGESRLTPASELPALRRYAGKLPEPEKMRAQTFRKDGWTERWNIKAPRRVLSNPLQAGGLLLVGTWDRTVDALDLSNGEIIWSLQKKEPVFALKLAAPNLLLAGEGLHTSASSSLTAVRLPGGEPIWQREFPGHIEAAPAYSAEDNKIWLGTGPAGLWCLDAVTGAVLWHAPVGHVDSTPLLHADLVLFSSQPTEEKKEAVFWALRRGDGAVAWKVNLPGQPWGSPAFDPSTGVIHASTGIGQIGAEQPTDRGWAHAISPQTRSLLWTTPFEGNPIERGVILPELGLVFHLVTKGEALALRTRDGSLAWRRKLAGPTQTDPVLARAGLAPVLAAASGSGEISFLDARTGETIAHKKLDFSTTAAPLLLEDGAVFASPYTITRVRW